MNLNKRWQQVLRGSLAVLSLALLASCGGGKREAYKPGHMYIFGDEYSYINNYSSTANLLVHYSLNNDITGSGSIKSFNPLAYPLWSDLVAATYGKSVTLASDHSAGAAGMHAVPGETIDSMLSKMNATAFQKDELITISVGVNDIIAAYNAGTPPATLKAKATFLGDRIIAIVNASGARAVIAQPPDISLSPYATGKNVTALKDLVDAFDLGLRTSLNGNYGHKIVLVTTIDLSRAIVLSPSTYSIAYPSTALCTNTNTGATDLDVTPELCNDINISTTTGSVASTTYYTYLWAWNGWLAPQGQYLLGHKALTLMSSNWGQ